MMEGIYRFRQQSGGALAPGEPRGQPVWTRAGHTVEMVLFEERDKGPAPRRLGGQGIRPLAVERSSRVPAELYPLGGEASLEVLPNFRNPSDKVSTTCGGLVRRWYFAVIQPSSPADTPSSGVCGPVPKGPVTGLAAAVIGL